MQVWVERDVRRKSEQISTQFVSVESIKDYINKAKELGSRVVKNKHEISEGYMLY